MTRAQTACPSLLPLDSINTIDKQLSLLVRSAGNVVVMQDQLTVNTVNWIGASVGVECATGEHLDPPQLKLISLCNSSFWRGRSFLFTSKFRVALGWLLQLVLSGYSTLAAGHAHPLFLPCNYAKRAEALVIWLRWEVRQMLHAAGCSEVFIVSAESRIKLVTAEMNKPVDSWGRRLMADPNGVASECDVLVCTYAMNVGISFERHFKIVFGWFNNMVGSVEDVIQAMSRVRDHTPGLFSHSYMFLDNTVAGVASDVGFYLTVASIQLHSSSQGQCLAYADQCAVEARFKNGVSVAVAKRMGAFSQMSAPLRECDDEVDVEGVGILECFPGLLLHGFGYVIKKPVDCAVAFMQRTA